MLCSLLQCPARLASLAYTPVFLFYTRPVLSFGYEHDILRLKSFKSGQNFLAYLDASGILVFIGGGSAVLRENRLTDVTDIKLDVRCPIDVRLTLLSCVFHV